VGSAQPGPWREGIAVAALDPFHGYATALRTSLLGVTRVLDAFHVTWLGFAAVDDMRRRVQQESTGHRGRREDPLFTIRRLLCRGADNLSHQAWERLLADLVAVGHRRRTDRPDLELDRRPRPAAALCRA